MNWRRLLAVARKESIQIRRDTRSLIIVLIMPVILVFLFGYGVNLDLKHLPVYVFDREGSQQSQGLLKRFQASEYFDVVKSVDNYPALVRALDSGDAKIGIVIPWDFSERLHNGETVPVQALVDATDDNTANILIGYTQAVVQGYSNQALAQWSQRLGRGVPNPPISIEARTWFNENLESRAFILPGVLALVMAVIGAFLTSLTIAREWERGTMEQLISTPVTALEILFGKLAPYFVLGMLAAITCTGIAIFWFQVPFRGSFLTLLASTALFLVVVLSIGFFVSVVTKNQLRRQPGGAHCCLPTFVPAVGFPVLDRADAESRAGSDPHCSGALLHIDLKRHFPEGHSRCFAIWGIDSAGCLRGGVGADRDARVP